MTNDKKIFNMLVEVWLRRYEDSRGFKPTGFGAKEGSSLKSIIQKFTVLAKQKGLSFNEDNCVAHLDRLIELALQNSWIKENFTLAIINSRFDDIVASSTKKITKNDMKVLKKMLKDE
ncbi:MAG: hypothetical protein ACRC80_29395 [Waterburya sp.]